jgi:predicted AAA+ superfamily ATPase
LERLIFEKLTAWQKAKYRKPLILKGVRQVGKTWILKEFGARQYANVAYFNFDESEEYNIPRYAIDRAGQRSPQRSYLCRTHDIPRIII